MRFLVLLALSWTPIQLQAVSQSTHSARHEQERGVIVSIEAVGERSKEVIAEALADEGVPGVPAHGVVLYRVIYKTLNAHGDLVDASGAVAVPKEMDGPAPLLSFQHGTVSARHRAPSQEGFSLVSMGLAGSGYVTALPDYVGLGISDTYHPYVHARSLGATVVDFLRATRTLCERLGVALNEQLFLVGYSEGGYATMAAHREIEQHHADEFTVTASAPMAGPYNLSEVMVAQILDTGEYPSPGYLPYTLISYDRVYDLFSDWRDVFKEPYASRVEDYFDGIKAFQFINAQLPAVPLKMLSDEFVAAFQEAQHPLRRALEENDIHNWAPEAPMRLFHCIGDDQVSFRNAEVALKAFRAHGAHHVELAALDFGDHESCAPPALFLGKLWLDEFKENKAPSLLQANIKIIKAGAF